MGAGTDPWHMRLLFGTDGACPSSRLTRFRCRTVACATLRSGPAHTAASRPAHEPCLRAMRCDLCISPRWSTPVPKQPKPPPLPVSGLHTTPPPPPARLPSSFFNTAQAHRSDRAPVIVWAGTSTCATRARGVCTRTSCLTGLPSAALRRHSADDHCRTRHTQHIGPNAVESTSGHTSVPLRTF